MIQDLDFHCYHNEYTHAQPKSRDFILSFRSREILGVIRDGLFTFPTWETLSCSQNLSPSACIYLFSIDEQKYFLLFDYEAEEFADFTYQDISIFRSMQPKEQCFGLVTGFHLCNWYKGRRFCGTCGHKLIHDDKERMMYCPQCQSTEYPKISPAVIVAVTNGNKILMSKYAGRNAKRYALIAGFTEIGETLEETVKREVMEEVGLKVKNIRYYKSQPWGLSGSLLAGFVCDLDGEDTITLDENELAAAQWFEREEIPYDDYDVSLTREMMIQFKKGLL